MWQIFVIPSSEYDQKVGYNHKLEANQGDQVRSEPGWQPMLNNPLTHGTENILIENRVILALVLESLESFLVLGVHNVEILHGLVEINLFNETIDILSVY